MTQGTSAPQPLPPDRFGIKTPPAPSLEERQVRALETIAAELAALRGAYGVVHRGW